jgi:hypothetical protein
MMLMVTIDVDLSHLDKFGPKMKDIRTRGLDLVALDMQRTVDQLSPIDEGLLHKWAITDKSDDSRTIHSPARYVGFVNYGHSQKPGRFIPGYWKDDHFEYVPGLKMGMVLKKSHVPGQHFIEKAISNVTPRIDEHFKSAISEVLG